MSIAIDYHAYFIIPIMPTLQRPLITLTAIILLYFYLDTPIIPRLSSRDLDTASFVGYYTQQLIIWSPVYGYICDMVLIWCVTGILPSTYVSEIFGVLKLVAITLNTETEINSLLTYRGIPIMHLWFTILVIKIFTNAVLLYLTLSLCDAENNDNRVEVLQYLGLDDFKIRNYEKNMNNDLLKSETKNQENSAGYHNTGPFDSPEKQRLLLNYAVVKQCIDNMC